MTTVLCVAEKPSLAASIARILSNGECRERRSRLSVFEFQADFRGARANYKVTSVTGHVCVCADAHVAPPPRSQPPHSATAHAWRRA